LGPSPERGYRRTSNATDARDKERLAAGTVPRGPSQERQSSPKETSMKACIMALAVVAGMLGMEQAARADRVVTVMRPGTTDVLKGRIISGRWATIVVSGDGDTDLDVYVYDTYGRLVGYDDGPSDDCLVRFYPLFTGKYTIEVVNRSRSLANQYVIEVD
jgi:hypothetical protein